MSTSNPCCGQSYGTSIKQKVSDWILIGTASRSCFLLVQAIRVVDRVMKHVFKKTGCLFELSPWDGSYDCTQSMFRTEIRNKKKAYLLLLLSS